MNLYKIREVKNAGGDFFRSVRKQHPQYQGLWIASSEGKVLVLNNLVYSSKEVLADLESALKAFGPVKPRQVAEAGASAYRNALPYRGVGVHPDGKVTLAVYDKIVVAKDLKGELPLAVLGASTLDSVHLNGADWSTFAPVKIAAGSTWTLPEATARKFFPLLGMGDTRFLPEEVTAAQFTGQVQEVKGGIAYLTYRGSIAGTHQGTASEAQAGKTCSGQAETMGGVGVFDIDARKMLSLTMVVSRQSRGFAYRSGPPGRNGTVVEWRAVSGKP